MNGRTNSGLAKGGFAFVISAVLLVLTIIMVADSFSIDSLIQDPLIIYVCAVGGFVSGVYAVWVNLRFHKQNANDSRNSWLSFALFCFSLLVLGITLYVVAILLWVFILPSLLDFQGH